MKLSMVNALLAAALALGVSEAADGGAADLSEIKPSKRVIAEYPSRALSYEQPGTAVVGVTIDADGLPTSVDILSESPEEFGFGEKAVDSVEQWEFKKGVPGSYKVTVKFRIKAPELIHQDPGVKVEDVTTLAPPPTKYVPPVYPLLAQESRLEGVVTVMVILENGRVRHVGVVETGFYLKDTDTTDIFGNGAYYAVSKWRFDESLNGTFRVVLRYTLDALANGLFESEPERSWR